MSQVLIGSQSKNFKALESEPKETSSAQRPNAALCQAMTEQAQEKICSFSSPTEWRASLRDQITEIGQIDPQKASKLSQKILFCQGRQGEIEELKEEGLEVSSRPHFPGLPGGMMRESEWRQGPRMCFTGKEYRIEIFHIPAGYRYKDYRTPTWELSGQASCSITHVVGDSKTSIDELQNSSSSKKMQALLQAKGLQAIDVGAVAESNRAEQAGAASASNRSHSHEAIVITGKTKYQMRGYARLNVAIEILLEPIPQSIPSTAETKSSENLSPIPPIYAEGKKETEAVKEEKSSRRAAASSQKTAPMFEEEKIRAIEAQQAQKVAELESTALPRIAFGKAEWERYFGEVGEQPPLPADIGEILSGPCPYWEGRRVEDTHMLVLIPETVNGAPLTLNTLKELIQRPLEGGNRTQYTNFLDCIQEIQRDCSYWVLMTKDVIPNSRNKTYRDQCNQMNSYSLYSIPTTLEATASILMHYVKNGERLYPNSPNTYTRCQEEVYGGQPVGVGSFSERGFRIGTGVSTINASRHDGVAALRKF